MDISTSAHHAGRAWDWFVTAAGNRAGTAERATADELLAWLLAPLDANTTWWRGDIGWVLSSLDTLVVGTLRPVVQWPLALPPAPA